MPTEFIMPKFDMDQETATVVEWLKNEGDRVVLDEPVLTVETDKVAIEVPSPASGILTGISVKPGDVVPVAEVIAYILAEGETEKDIPVVGKTAGGLLHRKDDEGKKDASTESLHPTVELAAPTKAATPIAARMAQSMGVKIEDIPSKGDRVTKVDVENYLQLGKDEKFAEKTAATPAARRLASEMGVNLSQIQGSGPLGRVQSVDVRTYAEREVHVPMREERPAELVPLVGIRRTIAERMQSSFQQAPHIALTVEADMTRLEKTRSKMNQLAEKRGEQKISITAILVKLVSWALGNNKFLNASLLENTIYLWNDIHIGVATAIEGGLIVPVIHFADKKSTSEINSELKDLSNRARQGALTLDEVKGGTFTISNLGMFGITQFRAVINPPESAILAVGNVIRKPVVVDEDDRLEVRPMMSITLSADHRVVDGVIAANFLADLLNAVESPDLLLY